jgi:hypothetical protein
VKGSVIAYNRTFGVKQFTFPATKAEELKKVLPRHCKR